MSITYKMIDAINDLKTAIKDVRRLEKHVLGTFGWELRKLPGASNHYWSRTIDGETLVVTYGTALRICEQELDEGLLRDLEEETLKPDSEENKQ